MKKAVIFDAGGVLTSAPQPIIAAYEEELGLPKYTIVAAFIHGAPNNAFCRLQRGEIPLSKFCQEFAEECSKLAKEKGLTLPPSFSVLELFSRMRKEMKVVKEMIDAVKRIRQAGLKTCVITNNWKDDIHPPLADRTLFSPDLFDLVLESCVLGIEKPDKRIYQIALDRMGVSAEETVFLDDLGQNLKTAREMGVTTILVRDHKTALQELESILSVRFSDDPSSGDSADVENNSSKL